MHKQVVLPFPLHNTYFDFSLVTGDNLSPVKMFIDTFFLPNFHLSLKVEIKVKTVRIGDAIKKWYMVSMLVT